MAGPADTIVAALFLLAALGLWLAARRSHRLDRLQRLDLPPRPTHDPRQHFTVLRFYDQDAER